MRKCLCPACDHNRLFYAFGDWMFACSKCCSCFWPTGEQADNPTLEQVAVGRTSLTSITLHELRLLRCHSCRAQTLKFTQEGYVLCKTCRVVYFVDAHGLVPFYMDSDNEAS